MDFQDSFQELTLIDANDWNNIPVPIMKAIAIMKKCIFSQMQIVNCNSDKITSFGKQYDSQLRFFDLEIKSLTKAVITNEDTNKKANKELSENLKKTTGSLQINLENEIGFLKKNSEGKLEYLEQQLEKSKKVLDNLPTSKDVDEKILGSLKQMSEKLRKEIKEDVKNTVTEPEFLKINSKISMIEPSIVAFQNKTIEETGKICESLSTTKSELEGKIREILRQAEEMQREIEKNATDIDNESLKLSQKVNELKKSNLTLENSIVSLSTSRHEDSKNISEMKQYIDKEILKVKESLKELVNRVPVKEKKLKAEKKQEEKLEKAKNAKKVDKPNEEFLVFRNEVKEIIDKLEENMYSHLKSSHYKIENSISALRNHTTLDLSQLKEKLYWLPVDLKELKGMPPTEARIFILEARLRSEENIRNDQYNKLLSLIDNLKVNVKNTSENFLFSHVLPSIASQSIDSKTPEVHRVTPSKRLDSIRSTLPEDLLKLKVSRRNRISMSVDLSKHSFRKKN